MTTKQLSQIFYTVKTLFLFTKSDFWTIMLPITIFSQSLVTTPSLFSHPEKRIAGLILAVFWTWLNLLQVDTSNQSAGSSPEEDAKNKPYRPIPAKRITLAQTLMLRWALVPIILVLSLVLHMVQGSNNLEKSLKESAMGSVGACVCIIVLTIIYNELAGHQYWIVKNGATGTFYAAFDWGATCIASSSLSLTEVQYLAIIRSALIIFTTVHAQDFADDEGDKLQGRKTLTLTYPTFSRLTMPLLLIGWSIDLYFTSTATIFIRMALVVLGAYVGGRYYFLRDAKSDSKSYKLYNFWLSLVHITLSALT